MAADIGKSSQLRGTRAESSAGGAHQATQSKCN